MSHPQGPAGPGPGGPSGPGREIQTFEFGDLPLRTVMVGGEPWFVAADVARTLGYRMASDMTRRLDAEERGTRSVRTPSGEQDMTVISEAGLYAAILASQVPGARAFKRWVTHQVLPALRRTGSYEVASAAELDELEVARRYVQALEAKAAVEAELAIVAPKAHSWDTLASGDGDYSVGDAAKILSRDPVIALGERRLFAVLATEDWIYRQRADGRWRVYQAAVERGWLSEMPGSHYHPRTGDLVLDPPQVRVTPKGLAELHRRLGGMQPLRVYEQTALPA